MFLAHLTGINIRGLVISISFVPAFARVQFISSERTVVTALLQS